MDIVGIHILLNKTGKHKILTRLILRFVVISPPRINVLFLRLLAMLHGFLTGLAQNIRIF